MKSHSYSVKFILSLLFSGLSLFQFAPAHAEVLSLTVGIRSHCPYGIQA